MATEDGKVFKILSLDGGGFRGIYTAHLLKRIEDEFKIEWHKEFDLISGTSTGAIIAAGLACKKSADQILEFYKSYSPKIFAKGILPRCGLFSSKYKNENLESALTQIFDDRKLGEIETPLILPATDVGNGCVHVFKSSYDKDFVRDKNVLVRKAVLASCAAPTFFSPIVCDNYFLADGGLWANNPALAAVIDAKRRLGQNLNDLKVFSVGTGHIKRFYSGKNRWWHRFWGWGIIARWKHGNFIEMILNLQSQAASNMATLLLNPEQMFRINFESDLNVAIDDLAEMRNLISKADRDFTHNVKNIQQFLSLEKKNA